MPQDAFGRTIDYLRISLIDHCNLRCAYCMPLDAVQYARPGDLLSAVEIERVARVALDVGFRKLRLTGGEPTLRADLVDIVERLARLRGLEDLALTTNGILLPRLAPELARAGLRRVNIHLDTLHPGRLQRLMRFGTVGEIWAGIEAAAAAGLRPIKLNVVVTHGYNDEDVVEMARLTLQHDWHVRFIELMPLGGGECARFAVTNYLSNREIRRRIEAALGPLSPLPEQRPEDESQNFRLSAGRGVVGLISPVSQPYCAGCNRMRLTADGKFHLCLLHDDEIDLRAALRNGGGDALLREGLLRAVAAKPSGHQLRLGVSTAERHMHQLGG